MAAASATTQENESKQDGPPQVASIPEGEEEDSVFGGSESSVHDDGDEEADKAADGVEGENDAGGNLTRGERLAAESLER